MNKGRVGMPRPGMMPSLGLGAAATAHLPQLWNAGLALALLAIGALLWGRRPKLTGFLLMALVLAVIWFWGEAIGGIFDGMGTDPNSAPLLGLMALPAWVAWRSSRRRRAEAPAVPRLQQRLMVHGEGPGPPMPARR